MCNLLFIVNKANYIRNLDEFQRRLKFPGIFFLIKIQTNFLRKFRQIYIQNSTKMSQIFWGNLQTNLQRKCRWFSAKINTRSPKKSRRISRGSSDEFSVVLQTNSRGCLDTLFKEIESSFSKKLGQIFQTNPYKTLMEIQIGIFFSWKFILRQTLRGHCIETNFI